MPRPVPVIDDVTLDQLFADPYPIYARLRREAPVAWLPAARINLVTRFDDIMAIERDHDAFPANDPRSLQIKAMGHSLMRKDGADHARERKTLEPSFRPGTVKNYWRPRFTAICNGLIDEIGPRGEADIFDDFAAPMAARALMEITGLVNVDWQDMLWWSQSLINATGNYGDDAAIWSRNDEARRQMDLAINDRIRELRGTDDLSAISGMINAEDPLSEDQVRANVKVIIGGGLNEPRDAICTAVHGLTQSPDQLERVLRNEADWRQVFEESVRWIAPIGMYPRRTARAVVLGDIEIGPNEPLGLSVASACHDESHFPDGDRFDVFRERKPHLAFGAGPHFCLGTWAARMMVGEVAVPELFTRLKNLRADPDQPARLGGWVFRGPLSVPVRWDS
ncbi:cytochrome P450 [Plastorhodobacter daqingensis]|uniref:Cytochrome P450 n=1 Tax=Plastorhodobacter daqingensis TaxID=1387281 RepID=A0ABW2UGD6_9RHOB